MTPLTIPGISAGRTVSENTIQLGDHIHQIFVIPLSKTASRQDLPVGILLPVFKNSLNGFFFGGFNKPASIYNYQLSPVRDCHNTAIPPLSEPR